MTDSCSLSRGLADQTPLACTRKDGRCNYHRTGEVFPLARLFPEGLCPAAFHAVYRPSLGLLFGARGIGGQVRCPGTAGSVTLHSRFAPLSLKFRALNSIKRLASPWVQGQVHPGRLLWQVDSVEGECAWGLAEGMEFSINLGRVELSRSLLLPLGEPLCACPALSAVWYSRACAGSGQRVVCPDCAVNITLESAGTAP